MAASVNETILNALRGITTKFTRLPQPLLIKVYLCSLKEEFFQERSILSELVTSELKIIYDDRQIEIEIVDMHYGTGSLDITQVEQDPYIMHDYLREIEACHSSSKSVFFIALIGDSIGKMCLPTHIDEDIFLAISAETSTTPEQRILLSKWYTRSSYGDCSSGNGNKGPYTLKQDYRLMALEEWHPEYLKLIETVEKSLNKIWQQQQKKPSWAKDEGFVERIRRMRSTPLEREIEKALEYSNDKIIAVFREWAIDLRQPDAEGGQRLSKIKDDITSCLSCDNYVTLVIDGQTENHKIDIDREEHETYLSRFKNKLSDRMRFLIDGHLTNDPDVIKGRRKTVQEIFHEHSTHLRFLRELDDGDDIISSRVPERLRDSLMLTYQNGSRHAPYFIYGSHGTGKSSLLVKLYRQVKEWFSPKECAKSSTMRVYRVIRFGSATPRSAYNLELLRVICQQISIIFNIPEGYLPKDASFDPLYINNWFQNLVRRCEDMNNDILFIFIDDLHKLNPLDCDNAAALSWLPISLPWNVHVICTTSTPIDQLKFTPVQKDRFKSMEYTFDLTLEINRTEVKKIKTHKSDDDGSSDVVMTFEEYIIRTFDTLEKCYSKKGFSRLAAYITCSEYGLSETELLELLMPLERPEMIIETERGNFNYSSLCRIRNEMKFLIQEKVMSGKILLQWRHSYCKQIAKTRYLDVRRTREIHMEIASIFFNQDNDDVDDKSANSQGSTGSAKQSVISPTDKDNHSSRQPSSHQHDDTSTFYNPLSLDVSYSIRHVEESWHHLMRSDDTAKFKQIAVCNFDFLLAAVQTVSISYLRCLIEHVRCYLLDRDIELIYYTIRKSSDVLTRDPMQLGSQLISWLRPISEHNENDNSLLSITVRSATAWCDGCAAPLLVPLTGWLPAPLPSQIRTMTVSGTGPIRDIVITQSKQHLILATKSGDVQMWHIMSNCLVHTFKGHSLVVTCMIMAPQSDMLLTSSEDSTVIVWDVVDRKMKVHIKAHTAPVTCVAVGVNNTLAISGSEDSTIVIADIHDGAVIHRIDRHRGPISSVKVSSVCDVLISSSYDKTICLWSLDDYSLLNTMQMASPVLRIDISCDSIFLLALCEDNILYLRTLATGRELHPLKGHKSRIRTLSIARDSQRAVVGCEDTRALIYDMHSSRLIRSMPPNPGPVTAVHAMDNDDFLITVGGNKITFYSFRNEELYVHPYSHNHRRKRSLKRTGQTTTQRSPSTPLPPITCFDVSRDSQLLAVASGKNVHLMKINTPEYQLTFDGHSSVVTCTSFSPNGEFLATGSDDKTVVVWGVMSGLITNIFQGHSAPITCVTILMDSRRAISTDCDGLAYVWLLDTGNVMQTIQGPYKSLASTNNMKFAICTNGDNNLKIWSLTREDEKYTVSHSDDITCFTTTADSLYVITGSRDMSLKVWQATGGKLAQVLVGHTDAVTCVAVSVMNKTQVISGSKDCNLIIWDLHTGEEIHTLAGHLGQVTCVRMSADGTTTVSGSDDKTLIVWEVKRGLALTSLQIHVPFIRFDISLDASRILVQLVDCFNLPIICLHNTPASYVKLPTYSAPAQNDEDLRPQGAKRQARRLLKKEVSLDTYTWQKKYGHLTSSVMMAQVDERLKRRFSVSASMEEISKISEIKTINSQTNLGPEQAALAQSQHFDQLEALWNKRSPPRRRHNACLSRQTSLVEDRLELSDDEYHDERSGMSYASSKTVGRLDTRTSPSLHGMLKMRPMSLPTGAWETYSLNAITPRTLKDIVAVAEANTDARKTLNPSTSSNTPTRQPDLVKDLLNDNIRIDNSMNNATNNKMIPSTCNCIESSHHHRTRSGYRGRMIQRIFSWKRYKMQNHHRNCCSLLVPQISNQFLNSSRISINVSEHHEQNNCDRNSSNNSNNSNIPIVTALSSITPQPRDPAPSTPPPPPPSQQSKLHDFPFSQYLYHSFKICKIFHRNGVGSSTSGSLKKSQNGKKSTVLASRAKPAEPSADSTHSLSCITQ